MSEFSCSSPLHPDYHWPRAMAQSSAGASAKRCIWHLESCSSHITMDCGLLSALGSSLLYPAVWGPAKHSCHSLSLVPCPHHMRYESQVQKRGKLTDEQHIPCTMILCKIEPSFLPLSCLSLSTPFCRPPAFTPPPIPMANVNDHSNKQLTPTHPFLTSSASSIPILPMCRWWL